MLLIVGIGASAGGLEAYRSFFAAMPADSGMAFVLVQHLSPDHPSMLADLIGKTTSMRVIEASDGAQVTANCVLVIPPDSTLSIQRGRLKITRPAPPRDRRRPIDTFLRSLAEDQGENAIGIILAGTGSDGSLGMTAIKEHGGFTLAQAGFEDHAMSGMPLSAVATGQVDEVLAVEAMPARLVAYAQHLEGVALTKDSDGARTDAGSHLLTIMTALRARTGHDFSEYKDKTLTRRLQRRMQVLQVATPEAYIDRYTKSPEELDLLFQELLIGVTEFFRDPASFDALSALVLKSLVADRSADDRIRIWVPGCATGEEAISLAILLREAMDDRRARPTVQIFATDIDDRAIAVARAGRYRQTLAGLSPERAERWFTEEGGTYSVVPEIRDMCVFSSHSVIKHPPFSKLDLISCRNLLIYLHPDLQDRVMQTFHYALKPGGKLFLGSSESITRATKLFGVQDKKHRIFARRDVDRPKLPDLATFIGRAADGAPRDVMPKRADDEIDRRARRVTEKYDPPHVVVDGKDQIVRFSGPGMGRYVELSSGAPTYGLFDILRKTLRPAVRTALKEARSVNGAVRQEKVPVRWDGHTHLITLIVEPLADHGAEAGLAVIIFAEISGAGPDQVTPAGADTTDSVMALEQDLRTTRLQLQSTINELESANEELKSSNEEYQSVNEELQSSNEELETAKEEMQSVNEECQTINAEVLSKNEQLVRLNSDLKNLLESTEIATLFLDGQLRVKSFTPGMADILHVRSADIGRPISEVVNLLDYADLQRDVKTVLRKLTVLDRQVSLRGTKTTFILRIRPYRTVDNVIDGVVLTFVDMTILEAAQEAVRASDARYRMLFEFIDEGFCILEKLDAHSGEPGDFRFLSANSGFEKQAGIADVVGRSCRDVFRGEARGWLEIFEKIMATGEPLRFERDLIAQGRILELFAFRFVEDDTPRLGVIFLDISHRKRHEEQQELLLREMDHRVKNLFAVVGGMVTLSAKSATSPVEMARTVGGRIVALAKAHQLIRPKPGVATKPGTTLGELVRNVLAPHIDPAGPGDPQRAEFVGEELPIGAEAATGLALVIHELATNAAKYGALSVPGGRVLISWAATADRLAVAWEEKGGPPVAGAPEKEGFGSLLARTSVRGQLGGEMDFDWKPDGLVVHFSAAAERLSA